MIRTRTVFVLGAGASHPFGLPTGAALRAALCTNLCNPDSQLSSALGACGHSSDTIHLLGSQFQHSAFGSIDRFLAARKGAADIGRDAICAQLMSMQSPGAIYENPARDRGDCDWYSYLWNAMIQGTREPGEVVAGNLISFITYNYDTSLEYFFCNAFAAGYGLHSEQAWEMASRIKVHHVYGALARETRDRYLQYPTGLPNRLSSITDISRQIAVMPDQRPTVDPTCVDFLTHARQVFFLGFGYDEMNCDRIGLGQLRSDSDDRNNQRNTYGTALGLKTAERALAAQRAQTRAHVDLRDVTCLELLRECADRLS